MANNKKLSDNLKDSEPQENIDYKKLSNDNPLHSKPFVKWERTQIISPFHGNNLEKTREINTSFKTSKIQRNNIDSKKYQKSSFKSIDEYLEEKNRQYHNNKFFTKDIEIPNVVISKDNKPKVKKSVAEKHNLKNESQEN